VSPAVVAAAAADEAGATWPGLLHRLIAGVDLAEAETTWAMDRIMTGEATPAQVAGFLVALRAKGETTAELAGLAGSMLDHAAPISVPGPAVDVVGTGGDRAHTVNISTMAALVVAGSGARVVKHGNRAASSACGSADVLEALGVRLDLPVDRVAEVAVEVGITFCFAQLFHPSMRHAAAARRELAVPTAFNFLGPLTNPARPGAMAVGVADRRMASLMAGVLAGRGTSALVFRGDDGLDELTTSGPSTVWEVRDGAVVEQTFDPQALGVARSAVQELRGGDAQFNAGVVREVLAGRRGPVRDVVLLNAAAALVAASAAPDAAGPTDPVGTDVHLVDRMAGAWATAAESVDTGAAALVLDRWIAATAARG
jgi:anthranilate phosphoribosyltransferase